MSRKSKSNEVKSKTRNIIITVALPIMTAIILGTVDRVLFFRKLKSLSSSLKEDLQSRLDKQNLQTQEDLQLLTEKQDQQTTILHTLAGDLQLLIEKQDQQTTILHTLEEESKHNPTETETDTNWDRLTLFSDGVFAIAITLLILDIHTPTGPTNPFESFNIDNYLVSLWKNILIFVYTFLYIGFFWNLHRQVFRSIKSIDTKLVISNLLVLLSIVFMPFTTSLLYEYSNTSPRVYYYAQVVGRFYAGSMVALGITFLILWRYASHKRRLLKENVKSRIIRQYYVVILFPIIVYLVTIFFTFFGKIPFLPQIHLFVYYYNNTGVDLSQFIWLILPIGLLLYYFWFARTD